MYRFLPPITCVFVVMVATLLSSCARDCAGPGAAYAAPPPPGPGYGSGSAIQQYALPPPAPQYGSPSGAYPYEASPGTPPYGPPPSGPPGARWVVHNRAGTRFWVAFAINIAKLPELLRR